MTETTTFPIRMRRPLASRYLLEMHGLSRTPATLGKLACLGGGPAFRKAGARTCLYDKTELDRWALEILGPEIHSTAEFEAA
jgi:hypothetical protein